MRLFKSSYKDEKTGQRKKAETWSVDFVDHLRIRRRWPLGITDKRACEAIGKRIEELIARKLAGLEPDKSLTEWLETISDKLRKKLVSIGLLDSCRAAGGKLLKIHLEDFRQSLLDKGNTEEYATLTFSRNQMVLDGCGFTTWSQVSASKLQRFLAEKRKDKGIESKGRDGNITREVKRGISAESYNHYLRAVKNFCNFMVADRRASENPLAHLKVINTKSDRRHDRRALEPDEIRRLLEAAYSGPKWRGIHGTERGLLYRFAIETGLRANEIRNLKVSSFDLDGCAVTVKAAYSKHRREDIIELRHDTVKLLKIHFREKMPFTPAFQVPMKTSDMLRFDLEAAGISYIDESGRYADFHALRHSLGSLLAASGVHPKLSQEIMRHSDINLTLSRYTHTLKGQKSEAIAKLPNLSLPSQEKQKAVKTGTDDYAKSPAKSCGKQRIDMDSNGRNEYNSCKRENRVWDNNIAVKDGFQRSKDSNARSSVRIEQRISNP